MTARRIAYGAVLALAFALYLTLKQWLSWLLFVALLGLPLVSLAISLPAMITVRATLRHPSSVRLGMPAKVTLDITTPFPHPPVSCILSLCNRLTGERYVGSPGEYIPTDHCGMVEMGFRRLYVYDYLGLFRRRIKTAQTATVYVEPKALAPDAQARSGGEAAAIFRPKPGGGNADAHDLRLYRPGDDLRHIHWKMAAKTGKLIYREPLEPVRKSLELKLTLMGTPEALDEALGRLLGSSRALLESSVAHRICCRTADGDLALDVTDPDTQTQAIHRILSATALPDTPGGDRHEP